MAYFVPTLLSPWASPSSPLLDRGRLSPDPPTRQDPPALPWAADPPPRRNLPPPPQTNGCWVQWRSCQNCPTWGQCCHCCCYCPLVRPVRFKSVCYTNAIFSFVGNSSTFYNCQEQQNLNYLCAVLSAEQLLVVPEFKLVARHELLLAGRTPEAIQVEDLWPGPHHVVVAAERGAAAGATGAEQPVILLFLNK